MKRNFGRSGLFAAVAICALLSPSVAHAYGGPGSIISGIGALLAAVAAVGAALFGFVWFPLKRLTRRLRSDAGRSGEAADPEGRGEVAP